MPASAPDRADLAELRALALELARAAARVHRDGLSRTQVVETKSSATDAVSEVDREAERVIVEGIRRARPGDAVIGEEGSERSGGSGVRWIVDPLDGTVNYLYRYPAYSVSIAVEVEGRLELGVVLDSSRDVLYDAAYGGPATCDGERIAPRDVSDLSVALVATGFGYDARRRAAQAEVVRTVLPRVRDLRRGGSAALDLCAVASGQVDGFYEVGLNDWDVAAGQVIVEAAGAVFEAIELEREPAMVAVAAGPRLIGPLLELLREAGVR